MTTTDVKRMAKRKIDSLSPGRAKFALEFLEYLGSKEEVDATEELLAIPGLLAQVEESEREYAEGKGITLRELHERRRKVQGV